MPEARVIPLDGGRGEGAGRRRRDAAERPAVVEPVEPVEATAPAASEWERRVAGAMAFLRRRVTGEYDVDEFGFDPPRGVWLIVAGNSTSASRAPFTLYSWDGNPQGVVHHFEEGVDARILRGGDDGPALGSLCAEAVRLVAGDTQRAAWCDGRRRTRRRR